MLRTSKHSEVQDWNISKSSMCNSWSFQPSIVVGLIQRFHHLRIEISWPVLEFEKSAGVIVSWNLHRLHFDPIAFQKMSDPNMTKTKVSLCIVFPLFAWKETQLQNIHKITNLLKLTMLWMAFYLVFLFWINCMNIRTKVNMFENQNYDILQLKQ